MYKIINENIWQDLKVKNDNSNPGNDTTSPKQYTCGSKQFYS